MISNITKTIAKVAKDKLLHFLLAYIIFDVCLSIGTALNFDIIFNYVISFMIVSDFIFIKELIDQREYNGWDWKDIIAGYAGVILKTIVYIIQII